MASSTTVITKLGVDGVVVHKRVAPQVEAMAKAKSHVTKVSLYAAGAPVGGPETDKHPKSGEAVGPSFIKTNQNLLIANASDSHSGHQALVHNKEMHAINGNSVPRGAQAPRNRRPTNSGRSRRRRNKTNQMVGQVVEDIAVGNGIPLESYLLGDSEHLGDLFLDRPKFRFLPECNPGHHKYLNGYCIYCQQYTGDAKTWTGKYALGSDNDPGILLRSSFPNIPARPDIFGRSSASISSIPQPHEMGPRMSQDTMWSCVSGGMFGDKTELGVQVHQDRVESRLPSLDRGKVVDSRKSARKVKSLRYAARKAMSLVDQLTGLDRYKNSLPKKTRRRMVQTSMSNATSAGIQHIFDDGGAHYTKANKYPCFLKTAIVKIADFKEKESLIAPLWKTLGYRYDNFNFGSLPVHLRGMKPAEDFRHEKITEELIESRLNYDLCIFLYAKKLPPSEYLDKKGVFDRNLVLVHMHKLTEQFYTKNDGDISLDERQRNVYTQSYVASETSKEFLLGDHATTDTKRSGFYKACAEHPRLIATGVVSLGVLSLLLRPKPSAVMVVGCTLLQTGSTLPSMFQKTMASVMLPTLNVFLNRLSSAVPKLT
jgi:hypothetical protein